MSAHAMATPTSDAPAHGALRLAIKLDGVIGGAVEVLAALILTAEVVILGAGVTARYLLHTPLVWSDELASILFLWLSMLGAVVALRRGDHMRMTGIVARVSPRARALLEAFAVA